MSAKSILLMSTVLGMSALATPVFAQPASDLPMATAPVIPEAPPAEDDTVGALVVTGTRLKLPDYTLANPVMSTSAADIAQSGQTNLVSVLEGLPALVYSTDNVRGSDYSTPSLVGLDLLNLRNLGEERTLVLVNGRRHVAGDPGTSAVDISSIPTDLVQRVDVLTGGASAIYGSDGVSGVVNFVTRQNFEGFKGHIQAGDTVEGGGGDSFASGLWGKNFLDQRVNLTFSAEVDNQRDLKFDDRSYTRTGNRLVLIDNPADGHDSSISDPNDPAHYDPSSPDFDNPNIPDLILARGTTYIDTSLGGSILTRVNGTTNAGYSFTGDGLPFVDGVYPNTGFFQIGGSGTLLDKYNDDLLSGVNRVTFNSTGRFSINSKIQGFTELKYSANRSGFTGQPSYDYALYIPIDNPYIPASAVADYNAAALTGDDAASAFGLPPGVFVGRDNFDLGQTHFKTRRETIRAVAGFRGDLTPDLSYETSYVYGRTSVRQTAYNVRINERFFAATDAVDDGSGHIVCRSDLPGNGAPVGDVFAQFGFDPSTFGTTYTPGANSGCVPTSIFGENAISPAARNWINTTNVEDSVIDQQVATAYLTGSTASLWKIPTGGAISYVIGGEYRRESSDFRPDPLELLSDQLDYPLTTAGRASRTIGSFEVKEGFAEISAPLLVDQPLAKALTLTGAFRYSNYSTSGETKTYNGGLTWAPTASLMLRGTSAHAVRAPNINNLFRGRQQTFEQLVDPCSKENLTDGSNPALRLINCGAALAAIPGAAPVGSFTDLLSESVGGFIRGNPGLKPEKADTLTAGIVYTPTSTPGFSASLDWYRVVIKDAIQSYEAQKIIDNCYDLPQPNQFCALVSRLTGINKPGSLASFEQIPANIAKFQTQGWDFTLRYRLDPQAIGLQRDIGKFNFNLVGNRLQQLLFTETAGAAPENDKGTKGAPVWQATFDATWNFQQYSINYGFNYFSQTRRFSQTTQNNQPDYVAHDLFYYKPHATQDLQFGIDISPKVNLYGGINNFTDQKPETQDFNYPVNPYGRFVYMGLRVSLGG